MAVNALTPFVTVHESLAKVRSLYIVAAEPLTVTLVAALLVVPATVKVPLRVVVVSWFKLLRLKVWTSALLVLLVRLLAAS